MTFGSGGGVCPGGVPPGLGVVPGSVGPGLVVPGPGWVEGVVDGLGGPVGVPAGPGPTGAGVVGATGAQRSGLAAGRLGHHATAARDEAQGELHAVEDGHLAQVPVGGDEPPARALGPEPEDVVVALLEAPHVVGDEHEADEVLPGGPSGQLRGRDRLVGQVGHDLAEQFGSYGQAGGERGFEVAPEADELGVEVDDLGQDALVPLVFGVETEGVDLLGQDARAGRRRLPVPAHREGVGPAPHEDLALVDAGHQGDGPAEFGDPVDRHHGQPAVDVESGVAGLDEQVPGLQAQVGTRTAQGHARAGAELDPDVVGQFQDSGPVGDPHPVVPVEDLAEVFVLHRDELATVEGDLDGPVGHQAGLAGLDGLADLVDADDDDTGQHEGDDGARQRRHDGAAEPGGADHQAATPPVPDAAAFPAIGIWNSKVEPRPGSELASMRPPWAFTTRCTKGRPRPRPP